MRSAARSAEGLASQLEILPGSGVAGTEAEGFLEGGDGLARLALQQKRDAEKGVSVGVSRGESHGSA